MPRTHDCNCGKVVPYIDEEFDEVIVSFPKDIWLIIVKLSFSNQRIPRPLFGVFIYQTRRTQHVICFPCVESQVKKAFEVDEVFTDLYGGVYIYLTTGGRTKRHYIN
jgi:hypothetical protein